MTPTRTTPQPTAPAASAGPVPALRNASVIATVRALANSDENYDGPHLYGCARPRHAGQTHPDTCLYAEHLAGSTLPGALTAANLVRLASALDDAEPTARELRALRWLATWEPETVSSLVDVLQRVTTAAVPGAAATTTGADR